MREIRKAAVLGAGVMGAQIAAHLANVGIPTLLLDIVAVEPAIRRLGELKPAPAYTPDRLKLITPGDLRKDLARLAEVDWIVEAVVENLDVKRELWASVEPHWRPGAIVSSNTSGISIRAMTEGRSAEFRRHFLGTHFFNPPRYLRLLEIIPLSETDPEIVASMAEFGTRVLGKGVVRAKDTPNFIANRIGTYGLMRTLAAMKEFGLGVDDVDFLTGPLMGRPKSATFRTLDVVGLDTFLSVARTCFEHVPDPAEREAFRPPAYLEEMVRRGWIGQKAGQGFFKQVKGENGKEILALDLDTLEYRPRRKLKSASLDAAKAAGDLPARLRALIAADDAAGRFAWTVTKGGWLYAAAKLGEIADGLESIDRALKLGFNWEMGPFELWDAVGVRAAVERMRAEGDRVPAWVEAMLAAGHETFYRGLDGRREAYRPAAGGYAPVPADPRALSLSGLRARAGGVVKTNGGASLVDLGDDVLGLELHSPKDAIGPEIIELMHVAADEVPRSWRGLVIGSRSQNFCVGANLFLIGVGAANEAWDQIDQMVRQFQGVCMRLKYLSRPVVAAPFGLTLGGGVEISYGAAAIQAGAETYMGLVETAVGLIPGGGGNKELYMRMLDAGHDPRTAARKAFEAIGMAKVSTSAAEARDLGYLTERDRVSINAEHHLYEAKRRVLELDAQGYRAPQPRLIPVAGPDGRALLEVGIDGMLRGRYISEYDAHVGKKLAYVLTGGEVSGGSAVSEDYLLDLEREVFLSLCGEQKTRDRMQHMLTTGKPLRN